MSMDPQDTSQTFDFEQTLEELEQLANEQAHQPARVQAIESAALALHFIHELGRLDDFREHLRNFRTGQRPQTGAEPSFDTMSDAMDWLHAQREPRYGARVNVAGVRHAVMRERADRWLLIPAPRTPSEAPEGQ
ncbi:hypothetical protein ATI61_101597 [Archangium gephyra]|uniref:Uncharacterized protein n=1 Tax=Archangium gephyra TaxID=48 RepID=A0AAC8QAX9_9BACT|nr:hypothetical protein [Archangium gephyra]AKJ04312.1 Hypothetical protein AA314_05938 [Archangium gephyra]REG37610.1 hypothetical protein ATI61_101597 [Archangium gephyra]